MLARAVADTGSSLHIHVAEDRADVDDSRARHGATVVERLDRRGLLASRALLAHCVHLGPDEIQVAHAKGCWIAHNPRSNMNNGVGYAKPRQRPNRIVLGTDGIGADMLEEVRLAYVRLREDDVLATPALPWEWLEAGQRFFPEVAQDRVTWSYDHVDSPWHLAFTPGVRALRVEVDGEVLLDDGRPTRVDLDEVRAKAAEQAARLHARL
jgi:hypothetical protein